MFALHKYCWASLLVQRHQHPSLSLSVGVSTGYVHWKAVYLRAKSIYSKHGMKYLDSRSYLQTAKRKYRRQARPIEWTLVGQIGDAIVVQEACHGARGTNRKGPSRIRKYKALSRPFSSASNEVLELLLSLKYWKLRIDILATRSRRWGHNAGEKLPYESLSSS